MGLKIINGVTIVIKVKSNIFPLFSNNSQNIINKHAYKIKPTIYNFQIALKLFCTFIPYLDKIMIIFQSTDQVNQVNQVNKFFILETDSSNIKYVEKIEQIIKPL